MDNPESGVTQTNTPSKSDGEIGLAGLELVGSAAQNKKKPKKRFERPNNLVGNIERMIEEARDESKN